MNEKYYRIKKPQVISELFSVSGNIDKITKPVSNRGLPYLLRVHLQGMGLRRVSPLLETDNALN